MQEIKLKSFFNLKLKEWQDTPLPLIAKPEEALTFLSSYIFTGEAFLAKLPDKSSRTSEEQLITKAIHHSCRQCRTWFMKSHALWLYDKLTANRTIYRRLNELVLSAADLVSGLVPTKEQLTKEYKCLQADKEGREIDLGIFFWGLFRVPEVGIHLREAMLRPTVYAQSLLAKFIADKKISLDKMTIEKQGAVAYLTIDNQACLNAEDDDLIKDMEVAVDLALLHEEVCAGVLRGGIMSHPKYLNQRVFSAGINLKHLHQGKISFVDFLLGRELSYINKIKHGLSLSSHDQFSNTINVSKPWLAVVDSFAIGGGAQLLLVFDRVIAVEGSYFSLPAAQEGIIPGLANFRLSKQTGSRIARQIILGGKKVYTQETEAKLLFDEVVNPKNIDVAIKESIRQLISPAVKANRRMLNLADEPLADFCSYMAEFALEQSKRLYSQDVLDKIWN